MISNISGCKFILCILNLYSKDCTLIRAIRIQNIILTYDMLINFSSLENLFFLFFFWQCGMWDLIPWFGIESMSPAMILRSPNQWTTKEDPWKSLLSPEAHSNIHIQTVKRGYSGLFLHVPLSMTLDDGKALFQQSETCFPPLPSTYHWYFVQVSVSQCKQNKTKQKKP